MNSADFHQIKLIDPTLLRPHEMHDQQHAIAIQEKIRTLNSWTAPIIVDSCECIILDGHHRYAAAQALGLELVPCYVVDYNDTDIHLDSWRPGVMVNREAVRSAARTGNLMNKKTSRHRFVDKFPKAHLPLSMLRPGISE